jgi:hypothetical protein
MTDKGVPWVRNQGSMFYAFHGKVIADVAEELRACREEFFEAVRQMRNQYVDLLSEAEFTLGAAYDPGDYLSAEEFEQSFTWDLEVVEAMSLSNIKRDFREKLPKEFAEEQVKKAETRLKNQVVKSVHSVMERIVRDLAGDGTRANPGLINRIMTFNPNEEDRRKGNSYRDVSLYDSLDDFSDFVDNVNDMLEGHEKLEDLSGKLNDFRHTVRPSDPALVRTNTEVRENVVSELRKIVGFARESEAELEASGFAQFL